MNGIGTLNETARNMFRGPRGVGAYQQFANGGEAMKPYFDVGFLVGEKELRTSGRKVADFARAVDPVQGIMRGMGASGRAFDSDLPYEERKAAALEAALETAGAAGMVGIGALAKQPAKNVLMDVLTLTGAPSSVAEDAFLTPKVTDSPSDPSRRAFLKNATATVGVAAIAPEVITEVLKKGSKAAPKGSLGTLLKNMDGYSEAQNELYRKLGQLTKQIKGKATEESMAARSERNPALKGILMDEKTVQEIDETRPVVEEINKLRHEIKNNSFLRGADLRKGVEDLTPNKIQQATNDEIDNLLANIEGSESYLFESLGDTDAFQSILTEAKKRGMDKEFNEGMDPARYGQDAAKYPTTWQVIQDFSEEGFAQGGEVMQGVGSLNETARNMTRGPRGIAAYQQFASGGEAMGPPPTRGPDPQGIGYFQQFADGGPVYMQEGGDPFAEVDFDKLTAAVIQTESAGDPNAVSEDDAIGLMQVLPSTGAQPGYEKLGAQNVFDIAIDLGFPIDDSERTVEKARELLFEPEINVAFGTKYLRAMIAHSGGDIKQALQKYNAGTGNYQAFVEGRKPLDQEAVRYPVLVANALTGGNLALPEASPFTPTPVQRGEDLIMSMPIAQSDAMSPLAIENRREGTEFQGQDAYSAGENLSRQTRQDFGSQAQQDDFEAMAPQNISMREKYSAENLAAELVGGEEALNEGIGGLTESLRAKRAKLRPSEVEFGEDKGGVFRSLMPPRRPKKEYPGNDTDALMRGLRGIRGRTLRKGFTPYVQDVRGELT